MEVVDTPPAAGQGPLSSLNPLYSVSKGKNGIVRRKLSALDLVALLHALRGLLGIREGKGLRTRDVTNINLPLRLGIKL